MLKDKKILLGICGSIAAYKSALLVRLLVKEGADVQVVMTKAATDFITPLTLSTLSKKPVFSEFVANKNGQWNNHVELGLWADLIIIAPATAHSLAKMANGICDDLLTACYLSAKCPVYIAPAMDLDMYIHPSTIANLNKLQSFGNTIVKATFGELASGLIGDGRMAEPEEIVEHLEVHFEKSEMFSGQNVLITAGPTQEPIDPVRYISNHSTGKMGIAIAEKFANSGANVTLILGKTSQKVNNKNIQIIPVISAQEMFLATEKAFKDANIVVFSAAVADYTPEIVANKKIKKAGDSFSIILKKTIDIAATLGKLKKSHQVLVGFALETDNEMAHAQDKLIRKNLDMVVLNSMQNAGAGFGHDTNKITIVKPNNEITEYSLKSKTDVANDIVSEIWHVTLSKK